MSKVVCPECGYAFVPQTTLPPENPRKEETSEETTTKPSTPATPQEKPKRLYYWSAEDTSYISEAKLKEAHSEACDPGTHHWISTFVFAKYRCTRCKATYESQR